MKVVNLINEIMASELEEIGREIFPADSVYSIEEDGIQIMAVNLIDEDVMAATLPTTWAKIEETFSEDPAGFSFVMYLSSQGVGYTLYQTGGATTVEVAGTNKFGEAPITDESNSILAAIKAEELVGDALAGIGEKA